MDDFVKKRDADVERELRSDLELEEEEQREGGISGEEARYAALRAFGNPTLVREQSRATWSWNWLNPDTRSALNRAELPGMSLIEHLEELRKRIYSRCAWRFAQALAVP